eukprot:CAMPEP_0202920082 /NCGR_PEP_ID=MMETSP1392-20130828/76672_1 /ASSEMBLY_ACC=CAM_ASM_000868 /TAXON_ID=225041 /ORGANISM="Chlamydomonas chlamydogama, Strain SAG 11-48b" /LENGTH=203 /DNA_ID=CAMNT_0049613563 /DNA_START=565 /DNA_END=1176 /DNA_ORIENTATION=+
MALDAGELSMTLEFGQKLKDKDWFGKQDPYCIIKCGHQTYRSRTCTDGGKNPVWNETFRFNIINENDISLVCMDEDDTSRDDTIGSGTFTLARARERGTDRIQVPMMSKSGKQHGFISINLVFTRNSAIRPQAAPAPYPAYAAPPPPTYYAAPPPPAYYAAPPPYGAMPPYGAAPPPAPYYGAPPAQYPGYAPQPYHPTVYGH